MSEKEGREWRHPRLLKTRVQRLRLSLWQMSALASNGWAEGRSLDARKGSMAFWG